jgi:hypothetical protein
LVRHVVFVPRWFFEDFHLTCYSFTHFRRRFWTVSMAYSRVHSHWRASTRLTRRKVAWGWSETRVVVLYCQVSRNLEVSPLSDSPLHNLNAESNLEASAGVAAKQQPEMVDAELLCYSSTTLLSCPALLRQLLLRCKAVQSKDGEGWSHAEPKGRQQQVPKDKLASCAAVASSHRGPRALHNYPSACACAGN